MTNLHAYAVIIGLSSLAGALAFFFWWPLLSYAWCYWMGC